MHCHTSASWASLQIPYFPYGHYIKGLIEVGQARAWCKCLVRELGHIVVAGTGIHLTNSLIFSCGMKSTTDLQEARSRLLHSAEAVFARLGYTAATTREICRLAHSNRGAVNYHFRDKLGLYKEVLEGLVRAETSPLNDRSLFDLPPEKALAKFIVGMMSNLADLGSPDHYTKLMLHELAAPAEGLQVVVDTILRPRVLVLCEIVGRLIGKSARHKRTRMCVHSIIGQVSHYVQSTHVIALLWPDWKLNATVRAEIAEHVTEFSFLALSAIKRRHDNKAVKTVGVG